MEVSELIQQADIVDYISQYCALTERSDGEWWGLSPLKAENTPSFSVNREEQVFYDFSSGQGGDVLAFIRAYNHCSFPCAVSALKQYLGIPDGAAASPGARKRLLATSIAKRFRDHPKKPKEARHPKEARRAKTLKTLQTLKTLKTARASRWRTRSRTR